MYRLGILGGTFDPPHYAHLILAQYACEELSLSKVMFVPAGAPPHKTHTRTPVEHRLAMLHLAIADNVYFELSRVDVDRPGPHYTIDTVRILQAQYPEATLYLILGEDMYRDLPNWHRPQELVANGKLTIAVTRRPGPNYTDLHLDMHKGVIPNLEKHAVLLAAPLVEFSSTDIVERIKRRQSVRYMVPDDVLKYIFQHNLYGE